jgi:predicted RNA-binding Zn-ribbon protein involved in translation (DUF1610 family)
MTKFLIVTCTRCGGLLLAKSEQKTRTCPYCGGTVILEKARKLASANTAYEASAILQNLKRDAGLKPTRVRHE